VLLSELIFTLLYVNCSIQNASEQFFLCTHFSFTNTTPRPKTKI
jgi:hypothetical protein